MEVGERCQLHGGREGSTRMEKDDEDGGQPHGRTSQCKEEIPTLPFSSCRHRELHFSFNHRSLTDPVYSTREYRSRQRAQQDQECHHASHMPQPTQPSSSPVDPCLPC